MMTQDTYKCERCNGTGAIDAPFSDSDPSCPDCDGEGLLAWYCHKCGEELTPCPGSHAPKMFCASHGFGEG